MKLEGWNLRTNMKGDDVRIIERALRQLGMEIESEKSKE